MSADNRKLGSRANHAAAGSGGAAETRPSLPGDLFGAIVDDMVEGVAVHSAIRDEAGRIVDFRVDYANCALSRLTGLAHDELVGHTILELFPGRSANGLFDAYVRVVETGELMMRESLADSGANGRSDPDGLGRNFDIRVSKLGDGYVVYLRDVTARSNAESELYKSQEMLRLVLDTIPQRVFWKDRDSTIIGANAAFARDVGFLDPTDVVGKTDHEIGTSDAAEAYRADDREVMESGGPKLMYEERSVRPDGTEGWICTSKVPMRDPDGRVVGLLGTFEDITESKRVEEALRESERFLASIIENIPVMVFVKDARTLRFVRLNRAGERITGYTREQLVGQDDQGLTPPDETEHFASVERQVLETGQTVDVPEEALTTPNDGVRVVHTIKVPIFGDDGEPRYVLGISEDITARKAAEKARRDSEARYRHIIDSITDYVVSVKIDHGVAVEVSHGPGCIAVTGYSSKELAAEPGLWRSRVVPEDDEMVRGESAPDPRRRANRAGRAPHSAQGRSRPVGPSNTRTALRGQRRGHRVRRPDPGHHRAAGFAGSAASGPEAGGDRAPCGRRGPRLQQPADRDPRLRRDVPARPPSRLAAGSSGPARPPGGSRPPASGRPGSPGNC